MAYTLEQAQETFNQTRYLVENLEFSDEYPMYNLWKLNLANDALLFDQPLLAYKIASEFESLEPGTIVYKLKRKDETMVYTIDDHGLRMRSKLLKFKAMAMAGFEDEAKAYFTENGLIESQEAHVSLAWTLHSLGLDSEADQVLNSGVDLENLSDRPHGIVSNVLGTVGYYYANGDYDKAIEVGMIILEEGIDSTNEKIFKGRDRSEGYLNNHWTSSYKLIEKYVGLAEQAKAGRSVDFDKLNDGQYTAVNTGYILTPLTVTTTVKNGKIETINADQLTLPKDDRSGTATETIPQRIIKGSTIDIDGVSTATITSESVRVGIIETLIEAMGENE